MSLLDDILQRTLADVNKRRAHLPLAELQRRANDAAPTRSLAQALSNGFSIIGEIKRKSPSADAMNPRNLEDARSVYNDSPVIAAISVLTDEPFFGGSLERLQQVRKGTNKPILRKDFIVDEYQVWETRVFGADAMLLMCSVHERRPDRLKDLFDLAKSVGLETLVEIGMSETSPAQQVDMVPSDAGIWGINSRKFHSSPLKLRMRASKLLGQDFTTSPSRHRELRRLIPLGKIAVAESGIHKPRDIDALVHLGYNAALIGTAFLKSERRIADIVSDFAKHIADLNKTAADTALPDLALHRTASR
jgi:indole-3-glycerol phosphate synthase